MSETTRLVALGVASLLDFGISEPRTHLALLTQDRVATLLVSPSPLSDQDREGIDRLHADFGFGLALTPWGHAADDQLLRIASVSSHAALREATVHDVLDFTPPTDRRPFFFNMLRPTAAFRAGLTEDLGTGVLAGNMTATATLAGLGVIAPVALLLGHCFPIGIRLLGRHSDDITAWMWGVNGAAGVMASILAVMMSMWIAIDAGLALGAALYLLLILPMRRLTRAAPRNEPATLD